MAASGSAFTPAVVSGTTRYCNSRLVAASMRCQRMGHKDDADFLYGMTRLCYDGTESFPLFTPDDSL